MCNEFHNHITLHTHLFLLKQLKKGWFLNDLLHQVLSFEIKKEMVFKQIQNSVLDIIRL